MLQSRFEPLRAVPLGLLARDYDASLARIHAEVLGRRASPEDARRARLKHFLDGRGIAVDDETAALTLERWSATYHENERAVPGAVEVLETLRRDGLGVAVLTNHLTRVQTRKLATCGLAPLVDFMLTSEDAGCAKPDTGMFEQALARAGRKRADAVMVGDLWESDIVGARSVGIRAVWFNRDRQPVPEAGVADELHAFEPVEHAVTIILGQ
jgi:HAD superfamily hydrolase (TIGR01549 family)